MLVVRVGFGILGLSNLVQLDDRMLDICVYICIVEYLKAY